VLECWSVEAAIHITAIAGGEGLAVRRSEGQEIDSVGRDGCGGDRRPDSAAARSAALCNVSPLFHEGQFSITPLASPVTPMGAAVISSWADSAL